MRSLRVAAFVVVCSAFAAQAQCPTGGGSCGSGPNDISQTNGDVNPPAVCDTCPGHCFVDPSIVCTTTAAPPATGACPTSLGPCRFDSNAFYGSCQTGPTIGRSCNGDTNCQQPPNFVGTCGNYVTPWGGDGVCTISYLNVESAGTARVVNGTNGKDAVCVSAFFRNVTINLLDGNDTATLPASAIGRTYTVNGGNGDDLVIGSGDIDNIFLGAGNNTAYGNGGNDLLVGSTGDDILRGGDGNDALIGDGGRDALYGDAGNDLVTSSYAVTPPDSVLGTVLCGGDGDDTLWGWGPGHQCMDAGPGQAGTDVDCEHWDRETGAQEDHDVGTARRCGNPQAKAGFPANLLTNNPSCGCGD